jgi:hypothetical protein
MRFSDPLVLSHVLAVLVGVAIGIVVTNLVRASSRRLPDVMDAPHGEMPMMPREPFTTRYVDRSANEGRAM